MKSNWNREHWFINEFQSKVAIYDESGAFDAWDEIIKEKDIRLRPKYSMDGFQHYFDWKYYLNNDNIYSLDFDIQNGESEIRSLLNHSSLLVESSYFINASNLPLLKIKTEDLIEIYDEVFELSRNVLLISENGMFFMETNKKYSLYSNFEIYPDSKLKYFGGLEREWM